MDQQQFLLRFIFLDSRSCTSDAQYLVTVPADVTFDQVKHEIARYHDILHQEAKYVETLDDIAESELTAEDRQLKEDAERNNPYLFMPELPENLLSYICEQKDTWSFSRAHGYFNLRDGTWSD